jgi:hypothetical protein
MKDSAGIVVNCVRVVMRPPEHRTRAGSVRRSAPIAAALLAATVVIEHGPVFSQPAAGR